MSTRGSQVLGILTSDFSAYYDLVRTLRDRRIPFETLAPGDAIPPSVGVLVTTDADAPPSCDVPVIPFRDAEATIASALRALRHPGPFRSCVIGIDPGERPGIAVLADGRVIELVHARNPESVHQVIRDVVAGVVAERFLIRVGNGAPTFRDRILQTIGDIDAAFELVDERRSTPADYHGPAERDTGAATNIALTPGLPLKLSELRPARPSPGELRDIQRKSRLASGNVTITRALARNVALGRLTLDEAVDRMRQKA